LSFKWKTLYLTAQLAGLNTSNAPRGDVKFKKKHFCMFDSESCPVAIQGFPIPAARALLGGGTWWQQLSFFNTWH
jgi:hypothetical protein